MGCIACTSGTGCDVCDINHNWVVNVSGWCVCQSGYYQGGGVCRPCGMAGCLECLNPTTCQVCDVGGHWALGASGGCACESGYYVTGEYPMVTCNSCSVMAGCISCENFDICVGCNSAAKWMYDNSMCICQAGYYQ